MDTIEYSNRKDMIAAILDARSKGVEVDIVGNGRTLRFPEGMGEATEGSGADLEADGGSGEPSTPATGDEASGAPLEAESDSGEPDDESSDDLIGEASKPAKRTRNRN
jgi:hypothetical protein